MSMRDDDGLDAVIDRVARDMTAGDPPAGLAAHVRARVAPRRRSGRPERESKGAGRERPRWFVMWQPVAAAAAVVVTFVVATARWPERLADAPVVRPAAPVVADRTPLVMPAAPVVPDRTPVVVQGRTDTVPAVPVMVDATANTTTLPPIEPLAVSFIDDPVLIAEMSGLAMPIEIEPLQIAPLQ